MHKSSLQWLSCIKISHTDRTFSNQAYQIKKALQTYCELQHKCCSLINRDKETVLKDNGIHRHIQIEGTMQKTILFSFSSPLGMMPEVKSVEICGYNVNYEWGIL